MSISSAFLDELRARTSLSSLIGRSIKIEKSGREFKACCPFHHEDTPSFYVNDDKEFYHCFGCGAHGDAIRWLTDYAQMSFIDAVADLAGEAGMNVPARSEAAAAKAAMIDELRPAVAAAAAFFAAQYAARGDVRAAMAGRGVDNETAAVFGLGFAPAGHDNLKPLGLTRRAAVESGLAWHDTETGRHGARFHGRIMIPVHDRRGRVIGFGGRVFGDELQPNGKKLAKYINSPESPIFDKGRVLFNWHRAAPLAKASSAGRMILAEGYFDVIAMTAAGIGEVVSPMGTALTDAQLVQIWQVTPNLILLFDGDGAGQKAALRACEMALPYFGPGRTLRVALLPGGQDPDDYLRSEGRDRMDAILEAAAGPVDFLFAQAAAGMDAEASPEQIAGVWARLAEYGAGILDGETRAQYLAVWRSRFDREISAATSDAARRAVASYIYSDDGQYAWPDGANESERKLLMIIQAKLDFRQRRRDIAQQERDLMAMAKAVGFDKGTLTKICGDIEMDAETRETREGIYASYRRVAGITGPMFEAILPAMDGGMIGALNGGAALPAPAKSPAPMRAAAALAWHDIDDAA